MNKIKLSKKIAIAGFCILIVVIAVGVFGITNHNQSTNPPLTTTTSPYTNTTAPSTTSSSNSTSDYNTKVSSISKNANSALNDAYSVIDKLTSGAIGTDAAISLLQKDKTAIDQSLSQMQALNPPQNMQHIHSLLVSSLQDLDNALSLQISGLKNNNADDIQRSMDLINSAISKMNQAKKERSNLT